MKISEPMQSLRDALSIRHVDWEDKSDCVDRGSSGHYVIERTLFRSGTETISAVYAYNEDSYGRYGLTYGWPDTVEVMPLDDIDYVEPQPMTTDEILERIIYAN